MSQFANSAYFSNITAANTSKSFTHKMAAKASWHRNYVTITPCISSLSTEVCKYLRCTKIYIFEAHT